MRSLKEIDNYVTLLMLIIWFNNPLNMTAKIKLVQLLYLCRR